MTGDQMMSEQLAAMLRDNPSLVADIQDQVSDAAVDLVFFGRHEGDGFTLSIEAPPIPLTPDEMRLVELGSAWRYAKRMGFEPSLPSCPGCRSGDHQKCDEGAWDEETDTPTVCTCWAAGHQ